MSIEVNFPGESSMTRSCPTDPQPICVSTAIAWGAVAALSPFTAFQLGVVGATGAIVGQVECRRLLRAAGVGVIAGLAVREVYARYAGGSRPADTLR